MSTLTTHPVAHPVATLMDSTIGRRISSCGSFRDGTHPCRGVTPPNRRPIPGCSRRRS